MSEETVYKVQKGWKKNAFIDKDEYEKLYEKSVDKPDKFWGKEGERIDWIKPYSLSLVKNTSFAYPDVSIKWFEDGTLNVSANCIDRHLKKRRHQVAIIWEPDDPSEAARHITYGELHHEVNVFANVLLAMGVIRGDPLRSVRRVLAGLAGRPHHRLQVEARHHRRRGRARRQKDQAQTQHRRSADQVAWRREGDRDPAHRRSVRHVCRTRLLVR